MSNQDPNGKMTSTAVAWGIGASNSWNAVGWVILVGCAIVTVGAGIYYYKEHTKNKSKSTYNKHTKPRPGRSSEKKKQKKNWKSKR